VSRARPVARPEEVPRRSNAAVPLAVFLLFLGLIVGAYTVVVPALLGLFLLLTGLSFLSTRLNPFSIGFYLTTKTSWTAVGLLFLAGFVLLGTAYGYYVSGFAPILPSVRVP
jgi:hypothetical protein